MKEACQSIGDLCLTVRLCEAAFVDGVLDVNILFRSSLETGQTSVSRGLILL